MDGGRCWFMKGSLLLALLLVSVAGCVTPTEAPPNPGFDSGPWLQSEPRTWDDLEGRVVLVDFWTYSCINCIRTLPHLTAWHDTYAPYGLVIIGVHTPVFDFEKDTPNVEAALEQYGIRYGVVQDNDRTIWRAWDQRYWPAKYLFGADGRQEYQHFGEGAYYETETKIRELLAETGTDLPPRVETPDGAAPRVDITRELYAGAWRQPQAIGNEPSYAPGDTIDYTLPDVRQADRIYLEGTWFQGEEALRAETDGIVSLRFRAAAANFVADGTGCLGVQVNGTAAPNWGPAVDEAGRICLSGATSYDFYAGGYADHEVQFHVPAGFELYTFAFSRTVAGT